MDIDEQYIQSKSGGSEELNLSSDSNASMSVGIDYENRTKQHFRIPFPNERYAECAMKSLGVDPPFMDTKNRKTTIKREMWLEVL